MPRTVRLLGVVVLVTGAWTATVPFAGPAFSYPSSGAAAWTWTVAHWQLGLAPGVAAAVAGVTMLAGGPAEVWVAKLMAYASGLWLLAGPVIVDAWLEPGTAVTSTARTGSGAAVLLGYAIGPGIVLLTAAALAAGRRVATVATDRTSTVDDAPLSVGEWA
jgi:hypothetical protein